jgi:hypothetical protein
MHNSHHKRPTEKWYTKKYIRDEHMENTCKVALDLSPAETQRRAT